MQDIYDNHHLTSKARFIYLLCVHVGRVLKVEELVQFLPEGRTAIANAMKELKNAGYIQSHVTRTRNGQMMTRLSFTDEALNQNLPTIEEPVVGNPSTLHSSAAIANSIANSDKRVIEVLRTSIPLNPDTSGVRDLYEFKEGVEMGWPFEEAKPLPKRNEIDDEATGAVGDVTDKKKLRQAKYTKFEEKPQSQLRENKPEEDWDSTDLVAEFYELLRATLPGVTGQVNGKTLTVWIRKMLKEGATVAGMLKAIRMFFSDPRMLREPGQGKTIMVRFFNYYTSVQAKVNSAPKEFVPDSLMKKQEEYIRRATNV